MQLYICQYGIWNDDGEQKYVLVVANSKEEAENKLSDIDSNYEDYEIIDEEYYDFVIS